MANLNKSLKAIRHNYRPEQKICPVCGRFLKRSHIQWRKPLLFSTGREEITSWAYRCEDLDCPGYQRIWVSLVGESLHLWYRRYSRDLVVNVGYRRFWLHQTLEELHEWLTQDLNLPISEREILNVIGDFLALLRAGQTDKIRQRLEGLKELVIGLDGMQPEKGNTCLYIVREMQSGLTLLAENLDDSAHPVLSVRLLMEFGVSFDIWFSEKSLFDSGLVQRAVETLHKNGHLYQQDGAMWFRSTAFGDEKDRVVQRENGQYTYFASDIAYHLNRFERGFERVIDVWGADHHGSVPRVKGALRACGADSERLHVALVQFAVLYRGGEKVSMSTRAGQFVTLRELRSEVGYDAARFFYVLRKSDQHLDFDLDLAKSQILDNPVYYLQYAHARISSVLALCGGEISRLKVVDLGLSPLPVIQMATRAPLACSWLAATAMNR